MSNIFHFETLDSTSSYIKHHINELDNLDFVIADFQTNGKGRGNHTWESKNNENLLFSFLLKDKYWIENFSVLSISMGVAIGNALKDIGLDKISYKWPNDIYVNNKKICGVLLEGKLPEYIIIGIGLNINQTKFDIENATSVAIEKNLKSIIEKIFGIVSFNIKSILSKKEIKKTIETFNNNNYLKNKKVQFNYRGEKVFGIAQDIDEKGSLLIDFNGRITAVNFDEVNEIKQ